jgi:ABC-type xylose transport system permease subunit
VSDVRDDGTETAAAVSPGGPTSVRTGAASTLRASVERVALLGALAAVIVVFGVLKPAQFMTGSNFAAILGSQAVLVVLTCALLIPLTAGDYDLSIASTLMLSQMLIGVLNTPSRSSPSSRCACWPVRWSASSTAGSSSCSASTR